jgi:hypothetical protein
METALPASPRAQWLSSRAIIVIIGFLKLFHGCLMIVLAAAALELTNPDVIERVRQWVIAFDVGPYSHHIGNWLSYRLLHLNDKTLVGLAIGAGVYATVFFTEAIGLFLNKLWAEWMVVVSTSLLIPLEITEIYRHRRLLMVLTFVANVAIALYIAWHVRNRIREHRLHSQLNSTGA